MKFKELVSLGAQDLEKRKTDAEFELIKLEGQVATGTPPSNPGRIRQLKRTLARITQVQNTKKEE